MQYNKIKMVILQKYCLFKILKYITFTEIYYFILISREKVNKLNPRKKLTSLCTFFFLTIEYHCVQFKKKKMYIKYKQNLIKKSREITTSDINLNGIL